METTRYYGVSSGNGNDGVSHMFPDYIVKTDQPYRLAELAALTSFKPGEGQEWARGNCEIDGEADFTIYATFYESAETQEERAEMQECLDAMEDEDSEEYEELASEIEGFGMDSAWLIFEVFPWEGDLPDGRPVYESLAECFGADLLLVSAEAA